MNTQTNAVNPSAIRPFSKDYYSPDTFFTPKADASGSSAFDAAHSLLEQAHSTVIALARDGQDLKEGFSLSQEIICHLLWAIDTQLGMAKAALIHMSEADKAEQQATPKFCGGVQ